MLEIKRIDKTLFRNKPFTIHYTTNGYYDIQPTKTGFDIEYKSFDKPQERSFSDVFLSSWLDDPQAFGVFDNGKLLGYVEGTLEKWNNRYRISNIFVFDKNNRHQGIGTKLMAVILEEAVKSEARMVVLETQSCNEKAISFYQKHGFRIIGFDLYAYSNDDIQKHEVRIEMGKVLGKEC